MASARLWLLLVFSAALLLSGCGDVGPRLENGQAAPAFELQLLGGGALAFPADLVGKVVAVRFWADWCPFCAEEMHDIEPLYGRYRDRGLVVVAVNVRQDPETAARFVERLGLSYDVVLDQDGAVARAYGVIGLPTTFFVDREGRVATRILGESTPEVFEGILKDLL